jgi:type III pantothenate kinase
LNAILLAVEVGNSHTVAGVLQVRNLVALWRLKSDRDRTADELSIRYHSLFQMAGIDCAAISGFVLSSVVPALETVWLAYAKKYYGDQLSCPPLNVTHLTDTGITVRTKNPAEVGADRIVNSVAAWAMYGSTLIVVDFGTAITFDCVNDQAEYLGGTIHPGIGISLDALASRTAKLPRVAIDCPPQKIIGDTTVSAIHSGMLYGFGGLVDRMVKLLGRELAWDEDRVKVVATGGMAHLIRPYTQTINDINPLLTLEGLRLIHERNTRA